MMTHTPSSPPNGAAATDLDVVIVGGGPAGLAAAHALSVGLPGARIAVYERVPQLMRRGAGFAIDVNGQKALHAINPELRDTAETHGRHLTGFKLHAPDGTLFKSVSSAETLHKTKERYGYGSFLLAWSDLQQILADRLPSNIPLHLGQHLESYEEVEDGTLVLHLANQDTPITTKLLVAADGYFSRVRQQCLDDGPPTFAGTAVWRARVKEESSVYHDESGQELCAYSYMGDFRSVMCFPVSGGEAVWVASAPESELGKVGVDFHSMRQQKLELSTQAGEFLKQNDVLGEAAKERALKVFGNFPEELKRMISDTDNSTIIEHGMYTRSGDDIKPDWFGRGRVVIIGDACHPMRPTGQGLNQGLEDAYHLAHALAKAGGISEAALEGFRAARATRLAPVMIQTFQQGAAAYRKDIGDAAARMMSEEDFNEYLYGISLQPLAEVAAQQAAQ